MFFITDYTDHDLLIKNIEECLGTLILQVSMAKKETLLEDIIRNPGVYSANNIFVSIKEEHIDAELLNTIKQFVGPRMVISVQTTNDITHSPHIDPSRKTVLSAGIEVIQHPAHKALALLRATIEHCSKIETHDVSC